MFSMTLLPGAPGPLFSARRLAVSGPMVSARQATVHDAPAPPPLPLLVGRRRAAPSKAPGAPPKPPMKMYTDVDVVLESVGGCFATSAEPALASAVKVGAG